MSETKLSYYERHKEEINARSKARYQKLRAVREIVKDKVDPKVKKTVKNKKYYEKHKEDLAKKAREKYVPKPQPKSVVDLLKEIEELVKLVHDRLPKRVREGYKKKVKIETDSEK